MEFELEWLKRVIVRHLPDFYLHHEDRYMPCSAEFFMRNSELRAQHPDGTVVVLAPRGSLSGSVLLEHQERYPDHRLWMELDPEAREGEPLHAINNLCPVYAHAKAIVSRKGSSQIEAVEITYITLFAYNGHYDVIPGIIRAGAHDGDIEHITARVHPTTGDLIAMWYNSHRRRDGQWVPAAQVLKTSDNRPLAFIAKHGHGNYPTPGTIHRHFYLANDRTSASGPLWRPRRVILLPHDPSVSISQAKQQPRRKLLCTPSRGCSLSSEATEFELEVKGVEGTREIGSNSNSEDNTEFEVVCDDPCEWVFFKGDWGQTQAPICQSWYHTAETPVSRTALQRVFLHLWPEVQSVEH